MEKQNLPNATLILIFGILSIPTCFCYGIVGLILGVVALILAKKATKLYHENPDQYLGFQNVKIGKILAIIGIILGVTYLAVTIYAITVIGEDGMQEMMEKFLNK